MTANQEAFEMLKLHPCTAVLDEAAIRELAELSELIHCDAGHVLFRPQDVVTSIYLIIRGRLKRQLFDLNRTMVVERHQGSGGQDGGVAARNSMPSND